MELLQDLTASRERLEKALDQLGTPQFGGGGRTGRGGGHHGGGTTFYDAIYLASDEIMKAQPGRKTLLRLTDGEDNADKISLEESISSANRTDTMAYAVRIADDERPSVHRGFGGPGMGRRGGANWPGGGGGWPGGRRKGGRTDRPDGKKILKQIAKETGGGHFEVSKKKSVADIYASIEEELRLQYSIGYVSDRADSEGGFRAIDPDGEEEGLHPSSPQGLSSSRWLEALRSKSGV